MEKKEFYIECDRIFGQSHPAPKERRPMRTGRWGPREPGPGRFEGYGIVRWFSPTTVHVALRNPVNLHAVLTPEQALALISRLMDGST